MATGIIPNGCDVHETEVEPRLAAACRLLERRRQIGAGLALRGALDLLIAAAQHAEEAQR